MLTKIFTLIAIIAFAISSTLQAQTNSDVVTFTDPDLAVAVRLTLGLDAGVNITEDDLEDLTSLHINKWTNPVGNEVTSLVGLEKAINLENIFINHQGLTDISPIASLSKLIILNVSHNELTDTIWPSIDNNRKIEQLWVQNNNLTTLRIVHLDKIDTVHANNNQITNIIYRGSKAPRWLNVRENNLTEIPLDFKVMRGMKFIDLSANDLTTIDDIWTSWQFDTIELDLAHNALTEISHFRRVTPSNLDGRTGFPNLRRINLTGNDICNLTPLRGMTNLTTIIFDECDEMTAVPWDEWFPNLQIPYVVGGQAAQPQFQTGYTPRSIETETVQGIRITEFLNNVNYKWYNSAGKVAYQRLYPQWFEVYNTTNKEVNLKGSSLYYTTHTSDSGRTSALQARVDIEKDFIIPAKKVGIIATFKTKVKKAAINNAPVYYFSETPSSTIDLKKPWSFSFMGETVAQFSSVPESTYLGESCGIPSQAYTGNPLYYSKERSQSALIYVDPTPGHYAVPE